MVGELGMETVFAEFIPVTVAIRRPWLRLKAKMMVFMKQVNRSEEGIVREWRQEMEIHVLNVELDPEFEKSRRHLCVFFSTWLKLDLISRPPHPGRSKRKEISSFSRTSPHFIKWYPICVEPNI